MVALMMLLELQQIAESSSGKLPPPRARILGGGRGDFFGESYRQVPDEHLRCFVIHLLPCAEQVAPFSFLLRTSVRASAM